jgi:hypothetical protein
MAKPYKNLVLNNSASYTGHRGVPLVAVIELLHSTRLVIKRIKIQFYGETRHIISWVYDF